MYQTEPTFESLHEALTLVPALKIKVGGSSMAPVIRDSDTVILEKTDPEAIRRGDIIFFRKDSHLIAHRVIRRMDVSERPEFLTKGDAAFAFDGAVGAGDILGKIASVERGTRTIALDTVFSYRLIRAINILFPRLSIVIRKLKFFLCVKPCEHKRDNSGFTREDRLLALCARRTIDPDQRSEIDNIVCQDLDWSYFLREVKQEGVGSLVYKVMVSSAGFFDQAPVFVHEQLKNIYYTTLQKNIIFLEALEEFTARAKDAGIQIIIIKGLYLLERIYTDTGARSMSDIDIVVRRDDVRRLRHILETMGYSCPVRTDDDLLFSPCSERNSLLFDPPASSPVYFHILWHYINFLPGTTETAQKIDMDLIWRESEEVKVGKAVLRTFSAHHQLIYLCAHAMRHAFWPLTLLCDIREYVSVFKDTIDWERAAAEAARFGMEKQLYYGLYLMETILGMDIPADILQKLKPPTSGFLERRLIAACAQRRLKLDGGELLFFALSEGIRQKARFIAHELFPSRQVMALIRQKNVSQVTAFDYLARMYSACAYAAKSFLTHP